MNRNRGSIGHVLAHDDSVGRIPVPSLIALVALTLILGAWMGLCLILQQGRILYRLQAVEATPAPDFCLPRLDGGELCLQEYRGRSLLLVFSDPHCGPCDALAPHLEQLSRQEGAAVIMISRGDLAENQRKVAEHGLTLPVVLQKRWELSRLYGMFATPVAYLINAAGVIEAEVAVGVEPIRSLGARTLVPDAR